jgi:RNA-directed DNA polymerase
MDRISQKPEEILNCSLEGEARKDEAREAQLNIAGCDQESSESTERVMEAIFEAKNMRKALKRVVSNKGSAGVDGMTVKEMPEYLQKHWLKIRAKLLEGSYKPKPVRVVEIPKPTGGMRQLGIPTVTDRLIQQAILQVLQAQWDKTFSGTSYGFRPGKSQHQAIRKAQDYINDGYDYVVDIDLEKFFDKVNHDMLMSRIAKRVKDKRLLKLLRSYLNSGMLMKNGVVTRKVEGTPQGSPLSPLLSNLFLDDWDKEIEKRGHKFVRYADDSNIYVRSERAAERVKRNMTRFIEKKLKLRVNKSKSATGRPWQRKLLGFSFTSEKEPRRIRAPESIKRFKVRIKQITRRKRSGTFESILDELNRYMRGWLNYYGYCEAQSVLRNLDKWVRRRLRSMILKRWTQGKNRCARIRKQLIMRGIDKELARNTAASSKGVWRISSCKAMQGAFPKKYFVRVGLQQLHT